MMRNADAKIGVIATIAMLVVALPLMGDWTRTGSIRTLTSFPATEPFDASSDYLDDLIWTVDHTCIWSHNASGGWNGSGAAQFNFMPGTPGSEHTCGVMGWFMTIGEMPENERYTHYNIRWLVYLGPDFLEAQTSGAKWYISLRTDDCATVDEDSDEIYECVQGPSSQRAMVIDNSSHWTAACDNICCGQEYDEDDCNGYPDCVMADGDQEPGFSLFDTDNFIGQWISLELEVDLRDVDSDGEIKLWIDTEDGTFNSEADGPYNIIECTRFNQSIGLHWVNAAAMALMGFWEERDLDTNGDPADWDTDDAYWLVDEIVIDDEYIGPPTGFHAAAAGTKLGGSGGITVRKLAIKK